MIIETNLKKQVEIEDIGQKHSGTKDEINKIMYSRRPTVQKPCD